MRARMTRMSMWGAVLALVVALVPAVPAAASAKTSTAVINAARPVASSTPTIAGKAALGSTITARPGTWTAGTTFSYAWFADGARVKGATGEKLVLSTAHVGKVITVRVTGVKSGYASVSKTSSATKRVAAGRLLSSEPTIERDPQAYRLLMSYRGLWDSGVRFTYAWFADGRQIKGATGSSLMVSPAHIGSRITVRVTGSKPGYATVTRTSSPTARVTMPTSSFPISETQCPTWAPIKGNRSSMIYHLPGGRWYDATHPEECFVTEAAARAAGYRAAKG